MMFRYLIVAGVGLSLSACFSVLPDPKPANTVYRLSTAKADVAKAANAEIIRIDRPTANQVLNTTDIIAATDDQKLTGISRANWAQSAPDMIQAAAIQALDLSTNFIGVIPTSGARSDTRLHIAIQNFEAQFDNGSDAPPLGVVSYRATYAQANDRKLIGTYSVQKTIRADSINVSSIVSAIDAANKAAMTDIIRWLETQNSVGSF